MAGAVTPRNLELRDESGRTLLMKASLNGEKREVELLIQQKANVNAASEENLTPLHFAAMKGHSAVINLLAQNGAELEARETDNGMTPLLKAASELGDEAEQADVVRALVANKANVEATDASGKTALHFCAENNRRVMAQALLKLGASPSPSATISSPRSIARDKGHQELAEILESAMKEGTAQPPVSSIKKLEEAIIRGDQETVRNLVNQDKGILYTVNDSLMPAHIAASKGQIPILDIFLEADPNLLNCRTQPNGSTPIHIAAFDGQDGVIRHLIKQYKDEVNKMRPGNGLTPLYFAAQNGHFEAVRTLMGFGADPYLQGEKGLLPAYGAALNGHLNILRFFVEQGVDLRRLSNDGNLTVLHAAARKGHNHVIIYLNEELSFVKRIPINKIHSLGSSALTEAAFNGHLDTVAKLLEYGAEVNPSEVSWPAIHAAVSGGHLAIVELLLQKGAQLTLKDQNGQSLAHAIASSANIEVFALLSSKINFDEEDKNGFTPAHFAAQYGNLHALSFLQTQHPHLLQKPNQYGYLPVDSAASYGQTSVLDFFKMVMPLEGVTNQLNGETLAHSANQPIVLNWLLENIPDYNFQVENKEGRQPIHLAAKRGHMETIKWFHEHGISLSTNDRNELTILHYAAVNGYTAIIEYWIKQGLDVNQGDKSQNLPIHYAAQFGKALALEKLLQAGAFHSLSNRFGSTPAHLAAENGHVDCLRCLSQHGVDVIAKTKKDRSGQTPVSLAAKQGNTQVLAFYEKLGVDLNEKQGNGLSLREIAQEAESNKQQAKLWKNLVGDYQIKDENSPLPLDFYKPAIWWEKLIDYYTNQRKLSTREQLQIIMDSMTRAIRGVIDIYGNFAGDAFDLLKHAISPLIDAEYYDIRIYKVLKKGAIDEKRPLLNTMAECLLFLRRLSDANLDFLGKTFPKEVDLQPGNTYEEKLHGFGQLMQTIVREHVTVVCNAIRTFLWMKDLTPETLERFKAVGIGVDGDLTVEQIRDLYAGIEKLREEEQLSAEEAGEVIEQVATLQRQSTLHTNFDLLLEHLHLSPIALQTTQQERSQIASVVLCEQYYVCAQRKLTQLFIAAMTLTSGKVKHEKDSDDRKVDAGKAVAKAIPMPGLRLIADIIGASHEYFNQLGKAKAMQNINRVVPTLEEASRLAEAIPRRLTLMKFETLSIEQVRMEHEESQKGKSTIASTIESAAERDAEAIILWVMQHPNIESVQVDIIHAAVSSLKPVAPRSLANQPSPRPRAQQAPNSGSRDKPTECCVVV